jgi:YidC/Oxa1 family membrane protein insertase
MERRVLLAISLSFLVLFAYQRFFAPPIPPEQAVQIGANVTPPPAVAQNAPATSIAGNATPAAPASASLDGPPLVGETNERQIVVETQKVRAVFSNRGGTLRHWVLKEYKNDRGDPLDLIPETIPTPLPYPFALRVDDPADTTRLNDTFYRVQSAGDTIDATGQPATLTFELETAAGLRVRKTFGFEPASFVVTFDASVEKGGQALNPTIEWGPGLHDDIARTAAGSFLSPNYIYKAQAIYYSDGSVTREPGTNLGTGMAREGTFRWAGIDDHYFISALLQPPGPLRIEYTAVVIPAMQPSPTTGEYVTYAVRLPAPPQGIKFYVGPKQLDLMRSIDPEFTRAIYFGMFAWLAAPLLDGLKWVHAHVVGNWGWSIITLTILINLAMFPLRHKSVVSMRRMQEIQPQMKAIQDRYAKYKITDPERQKMNTEVMELYRSRGVNPATGCLPTLATMPFLFAFYAMLGQAIEIRGQDFLGWIPDLSRADPFYITPLLMGLTMFWQMRIQPATADPTQQKVMMFMPVMITVTMLFAPAGLVIYWLVSNVWGIGQQYFTNWLIGPPRIAGAATPGSKPARGSKVPGKHPSDPPKDIVVPPSGGKK